MGKIRKFKSVFNKFFQGFIVFIIFEMIFQEIWKVNKYFFYLKRVCIKVKLYIRSLLKYLGQEIIRFGFVDQESNDFVL